MIRTFFTSVERPRLPDVTFLFFSGTALWILQKKTHESINNRLALVTKSGKYNLGYKTVLKSLRSSKGNLSASFCYRCLVASR